MSAFAHAGTGSALSPKQTPADGPSNGRTGRWPTVCCPANIAAESASAPASTSSQPVRQETFAHTRFLEAGRVLSEAWRLDRRRVGWKAPPGTTGRAATSATDTSRGMAMLQGSSEPAIQHMAYSHSRYRPPDGTTCRTTQATDESGRELTPRRKRTKRQLERHAISETHQWNAP